MEVFMTTINPSLNFLHEQITECVIPFSKSVTTSSTYLAGAGGLAGDGFPLPADGAILGIRAYDGTNDKDKLDLVQVSAGDRISVYALNFAGSFNLHVRVNGIDTTVSVTALNENTDIYACVHICLKRT
jgi:hypothetical protein